MPLSFVPGLSAGRCMHVCVSGCVSECVLVGEGGMRHGGFACLSSRSIVASLTILL